MKKDREEEKGQEINKNRRVEKNTKSTKTKKKKKKKTGLKVFLVILLILAIAGGIFAYRVHKNGGGMQGILATTLGHNEETLKNLDPLNFVLIGESEQMSDTILLCSYNPKTQEASMLSIPRDTYTGSNKDRATPSDKINSLFQQSPEKLVSAVAKVTGFDVKNYIVVSTKALRDLVDTIGGVYYDVPIDMDYDDEGQKLDIDLKAGYQKLNGTQAEGLVRFRHNNDGSTYSFEYGIEDYGRNRTQREFIAEVLRQTVKAHNVFKLKEFADIIANNVKTNMDISMLKDYIPYAVKMDTEAIVADRLPGEDELVNNKSVWIFIPYKNQTAEMVQRMFVDIQDDIVPSPEAEEIAGMKIEILNGSGDSENLTKLKDALEAKGYVITKTNTIAEVSKTTITNRTARSVNMENLLKEAVGIGALTVGEDTGVDFTIIIGKDYQ